MYLPFSKCLINRENKVQADDRISFKVMYANAD